MTAGQVIELERRVWETEKAVLMEKNLAVIAENYELRDKLADWDWLREKCFFALVLALKLDESAKGIRPTAIGYSRLTRAAAGAPCNLDASQLWQEARATVPPKRWEGWIRERQTQG